MLFLQTRLFLAVLLEALLLEAEVLWLFLAEEAALLFLELRFSIIMISFHFGGLLTSVMN